MLLIFFFFFFLHLFLAGLNSFAVVRINVKAKILLDKFESLISSPEYSSGKLTRENETLIFVTKNLCYYEALFENFHTIQDSLVKVLIQNEYSENAKNSIEFEILNARSRFEKDIKTLQILVLPTNFSYNFCNLYMVTIFQAEKIIFSTIYEKKIKTFTTTFNLLIIFTSSIISLFFHLKQ